MVRSAQANHHLHWMACVPSALAVMQLGVGIATPCALSALS